MDGPHMIHSRYPDFPLAFLDLDTEANDLIIDNVGDFSGSPLRPQC